MHQTRSPFTRLWTTCNDTPESLLTTCELLYMYASRPAAPEKYQTTLREMIVGSRLEL